MSTRIDIPSDGPAAVLNRLATRLRLPNAEAQITRSVATHPRPTSLLALVEVAEQIGVTLKPGKAEAPALQSLDTPFVAHFNSATGGGFAVVEARTPDGFEVWDSTKGSRVLNEAFFTEHWSGIVATIETTPASSGRAGHTKKRLTDVIRGGMEPPDIAAGPGAGPIRVVVGTLAAVLLAVAVATQPNALRLPGIVFALLVIAGVVVASVMSVAISSYGGPFSPGICAQGRIVDCHSVLTSRFAKIAGFSLSDIGISFYGALVLLIALEAIAVGRTVWSVIGAVFVASVPVAVVLIGIQLAMRRLCTLCLAAHAINLTGAAVAFRYVLPDGPPVADWGAAAIMFAFAFCLVLFFVVPYLKKSALLRRLTETHGRMSMSPYSSLAQLVTEQPSGLNGSDCALPLNRTTGYDELVAFLHPSCTQCEPILREIRSFASRPDLNVFVALPPKDVRERALLETVMAAGVAGGGDAFAAAYRTAKERFTDLIRTGAVLEPPIENHALEAALPRARELVARAETFAATHVEGTPALFFNGLPFRGPLGHLIGFLHERPDLLPRRPPT